jgi:hypothetical protein
MIERSSGELYPALRWFLYDSLKPLLRVPITDLRAPARRVYVGQMYSRASTAASTFATLTKHFDDLIRAALVQPPGTVELLRELYAEL